jgi:hypothetical protein
MKEIYLLLLTFFISIISICFLSCYEERKTVNIYMKVNNNIANRVCQRKMLS